MSKEVDDTDSDPNLPTTPPKRTMPELIRSISHKFRKAIHEQDKKSTSPSVMGSKKFEHFKKK